MSVNLEILKGAYDLHVHCAPDSIPRAQSALTLAHEAAATGMAGIGLKDHNCSTVGRCHVLNETFEGSPHFFSSIVLNPTIGGLNPEAVETALKSGCDIVYFPTFGARHQINTLGPDQMPFPLPPGFDGITITEHPSTYHIDRILASIAQHDAVLATGHLSPPESIHLLNRAKAIGVKRMIVTHASEPVPGMSIGEQKECVALGAFIEHCFMACTQCCSPSIPIQTISDQIKAIHPEHVILSSDFGQVDNGPPVRALATHLHKLMATGISEEDVATMIKFNPGSVVSQKR